MSGAVRLETSLTGELSDESLGGDSGSVVPVSVATGSEGDNFCGWDGSGGDS